MVILLTGTLCDVAREKETLSDRHPVSIKRLLF
jgi:hypothetical protein